MQITFMSQCQSIDFLKASIPHAIKFLAPILNSVKLHTLTRVVITGSDYKSYSAALQQYRSEIDKTVNVTHSNGLDGVAMTLHGVLPNGEMQQVIFIKEFMFLAFIIDLINMAGINLLDLGLDIGVGGKVTPDFGLSTILHEFGHAAEYQISYESYSYSPPDREFILPRELDEYLFHESMQLWSEYFAERFAAKITPRFEVDKTNDIATYLVNTPYPSTLPSQAAHAYRIVYFLAIHVARLHQNENQFSHAHFIEKYPQLAGYVPFFLEFDKILLDLYNRQGQWNLIDDMQKVISIFRRVINYEQFLQEA